MLSLKQKLLDLKLVEDNVYLDKYLQIVSNESTDDYTESHHIIPVCYYKIHSLEVDNTSSNRVKLSAYNHMLAHYYLYYCVTDVEVKNRLALAFLYMKNGQQGHLLTLEENAFIEALPGYLELRNTNYWQGRKRTEENKELVRQAQYRRTSELQERMNAALRGKKRTIEQRQKMSQSQRNRDPATIARGFTVPQERRDQISKTLTGRKQSEETKQKRKESLSNLKWYNNGIESIRSEICPDGYVEGRLSYMTEEMKSKCSQKGKHWYTNGVVNTMAVECPEGFWLGKTYKAANS